MLNIDKSTVDFLVTENMVKEVEKVLEKDVPRVHAIVGEMIARGVDRIYFVACGADSEASGGPFLQFAGVCAFRLGVLR